jgi:hypothetical protein
MVAPDRIVIVKRDGGWQVQHQGKTLYVGGSHRAAMDYVAAQLKIREAMKAVVSKLISNYTKGKP